MNIRSDEPMKYAGDPSMLRTSIGGVAADRGKPSADSRLSAIEYLEEYPPTPEWVARAGRRNLTEKLIAGLNGFKQAMRGDSSFFAHAYRSTLVFMTAGMIGVTAAGWCLLAFGLGLVLMAELAHSAVDTLARAIGDPEEPRLKMARDIAAAGVLVAVVVSAAVSTTVLTLKFGDFLGWWDRALPQL